MAPLDEGAPPLVRTTVSFDFASAQMDGRTQDSLPQGRNVTDEPD
jgi:hypothetical protein